MRRLLLLSLMLLQLSASAQTSAPATTTAAAPSMFSLAHLVSRPAEADSYTLALVTSKKETLAPGVQTAKSAITSADGSLVFAADSSLQIALPKELASTPELTFALSIRPANAAASGTLLTMGRTKVLWSLERYGAGEWVLTVAGNAVLRSNAKLPSDVFSHLAVSFKKEQIINRTFVSLTLDGKELAHAYIPRASQTPLAGPECIIGKGTSPGLPAACTDLHLSRAARHSYPTPSAADATATARRLPRPEELLFSSSFEQKIPANAPLATGLRGKALLLDGRSAATSVTLPLETPPDLTRPGQLHFFVQPLDWDNRLAPMPDAPATNHVDRFVPLFELLGRSKSGDVKPLLAWTVDRTVDFYGELPDFIPGKWTQVMLAWDGKDARPWYDQNYAFPGKRRGITLARNLLKDYTPFAVRLNSGRVRTLVDELAIYRVRLPWRESQATLARFTSDTPLPALALRPQLLPYENAVNLDLCLTDPKTRQATRAVVRILAKENPVRVLGRAETTTLTDGAATLRIPLDAPSSAATGSIAATVNATVFAGETHIASAAAEIPDYRPAWLNSPAGRVKTVPPPWSPLTAKDASLSCWSSTYTLGPGGLLASCVTRGQELLAAPVRLLAESESSPLAFSGDVSKPSSTGLAAEWAGTLTAPGLTATLKCTAEFDGMIRHELTLIPQKNPKLSKLALEIPLRSDVAPLYHSYALGAEGSSAGLLMTGEGAIWNSAAAYREGKWKNPLALGSFVPMLWLGDESRGLCWFADNDRGWFPSSAAPALELVRNGKTLTLRLNFLAEPATLDAPRTIVFGLIPTPTKPYPTDGRTWHRGGSKESPSFANVGTCFDSQVAAATSDPFGVFPYRGWEWATQVGNAMHESKKNVLLYMSAYWIPHPYADWIRNSWQWESSNGGRAFYSPSHVDFLAHTFDQWFSRNILDGVYIDEVYPTLDGHTDAGSAYVLPNGKVQPGGSLFQEREFFKRLYAISLQYNKRPLIIHHMTGTMVPPLNSFATATLDGEDHWIKKDGPDFIDAWPQDRIRSMNLGAGGGNVQLWLPMLSDSSAAFKSDPAWRRAATRTMLASVLLNDMWCLFDRCDSPFVYQFVGPALRSADIADQELTFTPHFSRSPLVKSSDPDVHVSTYHKPGKVLLVVANFAKQSRKPTLTIDLTKTGLPAAAEAVDLETRFAAGATAKRLAFPHTPAPDPQWKSSGLTLEVSPRDYRVILLEAP